MTNTLTATTSGLPCTRREVAEYLLELLKFTTPLSPPVATAQQTAGSLNAQLAQQYPEEHSILELLKLQVLGSHADHSIEVFSEDTRQNHRIQSIPHLYHSALIQMCGRRARDYVHGGKVVVSGKKTIDEVRNAIALFASHVSLADSATIGQGVWYADGQITLVNAGRAGVLTNNQFHYVTVPRVGRQILEFSTTDPWVDFDLLQGYINAANTQWCRDVYLELYDLLGKWYWRNPIDNHVAACLVIATWVQTMWPWRPLVAVTGSSNSGKSMLLDDFLRNLFSSMAAWMHKPSEAAVRQKINNRSVIVMVDEFEGDTNRQKVLDLFRASSRGGEIFRGTADQRGRRFVIRHIPWLGNIESGLKDEADRNRFIVLNLERPPLGKHGKITLPPESHLRELGHKILAMALVHFEDAKKFFFDLKKHQIPDIHGRMIENYAVPAAILSAIEQKNPDQAIRTLEDFVAPLVGQSSIIGDELTLMREILEAHFELRPGQKMSVAEALSEGSCFEERRDALERHGIALVMACAGHRRYSRTDTRLFLNTTVILRYLLRFTDWANKDIGQLIGRLPEARYEQKVVSGKRTWGWSLPFASWVSDRQEQEEQNPSFAEIGKSIRVQETVVSQFDDENPSKMV